MSPNSVATETAHPFAGQWCFPMLGRGFWPIARGCEAGRSRDGLQRTWLRPLAVMISTKFGETPMRGCSPIAVRLVEHALKEKKR